MSDTTVELSNQNRSSESALTSTKFSSNVCIMENPFKQQSGPSVDITERELILWQPTGEATAVWLAACLESSQSGPCSQRGGGGDARLHGGWVGTVSPGGTASDVSVMRVRRLKILSHWGGLEWQREREIRAAFKLVSVMLKCDCWKWMTDRETQCHILN